MKLKDSGWVFFVFFFISFLNLFSLTNITLSCNLIVIIIRSFVVFDVAVLFGCKNNMESYSMDKEESFPSL